jgi:hypothetical protein
MYTCTEKHRQRDTETPCQAVRVATKLLLLYDSRVTPPFVLEQVRNQLVHNHGVNSIPGNREKFIRDFEESVSELNDILAKKEGGGSGSSCVVS